jgi:hypothetical protein
MEFEPDDFDWAMGELLHLFARANRLGVHPHHLDPGVFHPAWSVLNAQPFEIRQAAHQILMQQLRRPLRSLAPGGAKRYAHVIAD